MTTFGCWKISNCAAGDRVGMLRLLRSETGISFEGWSCGIPRLAKARDMGHPGLRLITKVNPTSRKRRETWGTRHSERLGGPGTKS